jgi:methionyl-tRNA synthetase
VQVLMQKYYQGSIPAVGTLAAEDQAVLDEMAAAPDHIGASIERYRFREALAKMMSIARLGNKYLADHEPWKKIKDQPERAAEILYVSAQLCAQLAHMMEPFMPFSAAKLRGDFNLPTEDWEACKRTEFLAPGHIIKAQGHLFSKIEDAIIAAQIAKLEQTNTPDSEPQHEPLKEEIQFEDFTKLDLRVGEIVSASAVKKANKLLHLEVDLGFEKRSIVSGIAEHYELDKLPGTKVSVVVNLAPRKLRGVLSEGMILMAEDASGKLSFTAAPDMPNGSVIR